MFFFLTKHLSPKMTQVFDRLPHRFEFGSNNMDLLTHNFELVNHTIDLSHTFDQWWSSEQYGFVKNKKTVRRHSIFHSKSTKVKAKCT